MAHIAIDARIINSSTGTYIERLLHYLEKIDTVNHYTVLVREKDETYWTPTNDNFTVRVADFTNYSFDEQLGFNKLLNDLVPDLVHFCMPQQPVLYKGKKVTTFHDLTLLNTVNSDINPIEFRFKQLIGRFVYINVARNSEYILTPTEFTKQAVLELSGVPGEKIIVTHEAAETKIEQATKYEMPFKKFILYVGQQPDYKNIRRLGEAHQKLLDKHPDLGLVLVGKKAADTEANEVYFEKHGYKNIHFTDFIPNEQRDWLMQHCEAYVFPSLMEGFGLPGLEAMAAGAPVIISNTTRVPEVYGDAAEYFNPLIVDDMAATIERVITDKDLRNKLIEAGSKQVKKYSWRRMAEQTHNVYLDALK